MRQEQNSDREIWLMDYFGRFLHNDPHHDRIVALAPDTCPDGKPGLILDIDPQRADVPFVLVKRTTAPMPLPQIEPVTLKGAAIALKITDRTGPYVDSRNCFFSSQPDGEVQFDRSRHEGWECYAPIPARTARIFFPGNGISLRDKSSGLQIPAPQPETGLSVLMAGRTYPLDLISPFLTQLGALSPGESSHLVLPALNDHPQLTVVASRRPV